MRLAKSWPTESTAVSAIPDTQAPGFNVQTGEQRTIGFIFFLEWKWKCFKKFYLLPGMEHLQPQRVCSSLLWSSTLTTSILSSSMGRSCLCLAKESCWCLVASLANLAHVVDLAFVRLVLPMFFQCFHLKVNKKSTLATDATSFIIKRLWCTDYQSDIRMQFSASLAHTEPYELVTHSHFHFFTQPHWCTKVRWTVPWFTYLTFNILGPSLGGGCVAPFGL